MAQFEQPGAVGRFLDRLVMSLAPAWGVSRMEARTRVATARMTRELAAGYKAARRDRAKSVGRVGSANKDLLHDLRAIRDKSRQLIRDDATAAAALEVKVDNVVGSGFKLQSACTMEDTGFTSQQQVDDWNGACERLWADWTSQACDANECSDFDDLTRLVYQTKATDGETLAHRIAIKGRPITTAFELIDVDRLDETVHDGQKDIRGGIELGDRGQPVAYHILPVHPDDLVHVPKPGSNVAEPIARTKDGWHNMLHVMDRSRPGQVRGVPMIVPALPLFEHLHHYLDSEIIAARVNSNFAMAIERPLDPSTDPSVYEEVFGHDDGSGGGEGSRFFEEIPPGTVEYLNPGEKLTAHSHNRPGTTFTPFVMHMLRAIAASINLPVEMLMKDFGGMNYSNARVALLEARRGFAREQRRVKAQWLQPVYETVIREGIVNGLLPSKPPRALKEWHRFARARWIAPAWGMVDPVKEAEASRIKVDNNLSTPEAESASAGGMDLREVLQSKARALVIQREIEEQNNLPPGSLRPAGDAAPVAPTSDNDDEGKPIEEGDVDTDTGQEKGEDPAKLAARLNAVGVAMRSGLITPQQADEENTRAKLDLPPMSQAVLDAWKKEPTKRPVTLARAAEELNQDPEPEPSTDPEDDQPSES